MEELVEVIPKHGTANAGSRFCEVEKILENCFLLFKPLVY
jgi:hypothetical protein